MSALEASTGSELTFIGHLPGNFKDPQVWVALLLAAEYVGQNFGKTLEAIKPPRHAPNKRPRLGGGSLLGHSPSWPRYISLVAYFEIIIIYELLGGVTK